MTYYLDGIVVVEGHGDEAFLSSFIKSLYVITNGYDLPKEDIDFLKHYSNKKKYVKMQHVKYVNVMKMKYQKYGNNKLIKVNF